MSGSSANGSHAGMWRLALQEVQAYCALLGQNLTFIDKILASLPAPPPPKEPSEEGLDASLGGRGSHPASRSVSPVEIPPPGSRTPKDRRSPVPPASGNGNSSVKDSNPASAKDGSGKERSSGGSRSRTSPVGKKKNASPTADASIPASNSTANHASGASKSRSSASSGSPGSRSSRPASPAQFSSGKARSTAPIPRPSESTEISVTIEPVEESDSTSDIPFLFDYGNPERVEDVVLVVSDISAPNSPSSSSSSDSGRGKQVAPAAQTHTRAGSKRAHAASELADSRKVTATVASKPAELAAPPAKRRKDVPVLAAMDVLPSVTEIAADEGPVVVEVDVPDVESGK